MTTLPAKRARKRAVDSIQPFDPHTLQKKLLDMAGFDEPARVAALKQCIASAVGDLNADKETPVTYQGQVTDCHKQPDYTARAKARDQLLKMIGADAPAQAASAVAPTIQLPPWVNAIAFGSLPQTTTPVIAEIVKPST